MLTQDQQAGILMQMIGHDRDEVRFQEDKLYNIVTSIMIASFAITAFIMGSAKLSESRFGLILLPVLDLGLLVILNAVVWGLRHNLVDGQEYLQRREQLLEHILSLPEDGARQATFKPFSELPCVTGKVMQHWSSKLIGLISIIMQSLKFIVLACYAFSALSASGGLHHT